MRTFLQLGFLAALAIVPGMAPGRGAVGSPRSADSCTTVRPDTAGWRQVVSEEAHLGFAYPSSFHPDTNVGASFATYHGGGQLTDGVRTIRFTYYQPKDLRLQGVRTPPALQTPGWPSLASGWTTNVATLAPPDTTGSWVLTAWLTSPNGTDHFSLSGSARSEVDLGVVRSIVCTLGPTR